MMQCVEGSPAASRLWALDHIGGGAVGAPAAAARGAVGAPLSGGSSLKCGVLLQGVAQAECRRAVEEGREAYSAAFNTDTDPEDGPLLLEHQVLMGAAV
jgi:hypothetical protein